MEQVNHENMIRLSKSCISEAEKRAVLSVLDTEFLGMGVQVQQFESDLTEFFERPAVCVVNGTAALHLALQACGIGRGDEVLVQSLTYVASFQAISATGAMPVACDIDPATLTLDCSDAEKRLTARTKAVMPVHYSGGVGALDEIYKFARRHGLRVIEDAAHAFGTVYQGKRVGSFGDIACFSFDGIKNITSGEGGCIVTDDPEVLCKAQDARLLGVEKDTERRYQGQRSWEFDVSSQGWRYHMSNIMAAIGIEQLKRFPMMASKRQALAQKYNLELATCKSLIQINHDYREVVPHIFPVFLHTTKNRDLVRGVLKENFIQTGVHYFPNHLTSFFKQENSSILNTDRIYKNMFTLPLHPDLSFDDVGKICELLKRELER